jgi:hypothetical protein
MYASLRVTKAATCRILDGVDCAALGHITTKVSGGLGMMAHQIPGSMMPQKPPCIPPPAWGMWDHRAHGFLSLSLSPCSGTRKEARRQLLIV